MNKITKLEINDESGAFKNVNDLLHELRNDNVDALAIVYTRKEDHSTRTFRSGFDRVVLVGILEQLKYDIMETDDAIVTDYEKGL